jgi:hypothetical protein
MIALSQAGRIQSMLQAEIDKRRTGWEASNIGSDNIVAIFSYRFGRKEKIWEGNCELCLQYIESL